MGLCLSPGCCKSASKVGISRLLLVLAPADGSQDGSGGKVASHLSFRLRQLVQASGSVTDGSARSVASDDPMDGSSGDVDTLFVPML